MRTTRWFLLTLLLVFSMGLVWACGDGNDEDEPGAPTATRSADDSAVDQETPEAQETQEPQDTPQAQGDGSETLDLARKFGDATFKATYEIHSSGASDMGEGTMTWYKKGDLMRMDLEGEVEGEQMSATVITGPDKSYLCAQSPELGGEGFCMETSGETEEGVSQVVGELENMLSDPNVEVEGTGDREVAGEDTQCFTIRSLDTGDESEVCLSDNGVPLYMRTTGQGEDMSLEATEYSSEVSDDDFEPPYSTTEDFPGLDDLDIDVAE